MSYCSEGTLEADTPAVEVLQLGTFDHRDASDTGEGFDRYRSRKRQLFMKSAGSPPLHWSTWRQAGLEETLVVRTDPEIINSLGHLLYSYFSYLYKELNQTEVKTVFTARQLHARLSYRYSWKHVVKHHFWSGARDGRTGSRY